MAISISITETGMEYSKSFNLVPIPIPVPIPISIFIPISEPKPKLQRVSYILYLIQVKQQFVEILIDLGSKVNTINLDFAKKLDL